MARPFLRSPVPAPACFLLWAASSLLLAGCPSSATATVDVPPPPGSATPAAPPTTRPAGPIVLFTVMDGLLAPVVCHDGKNALASDSEECMALAPEGAKIALDKGGTATLGPPGEAPCRGSTINVFQGRKAESPAAKEASHAVWPESAAGAVKRLDNDLKATDKELGAMVALLLKETEGLFEEKPKLEITSGITADVDGDGAADRVLAAHEEGRLYGVIAAFLNTAPDVAVELSIRQFDYPRVIGATELDGKPGQEVWISAAFVEGIEDSTMTSGLSERVLALRGGKVEELGSWGCRIF